MPRYGLLLKSHCLLLDYQDERDAASKEAAAEIFLNEAGMALAEFSASELLPYIELLPAK